jgi:topoisomerase-4 subunit A
VWYDKDVNRLNYDEQGRYLGEFQGDDQILVVRATGEFYLTNFDLNVHFEDDIVRIEKYDSGKIWTAVLLDEEQNGFCYLKRFPLEATQKKQSFMGENPGSRLLLLTDTPYPRIKVTMGAPDDFREPIELDAESFIAVKSVKAKGKRVTTFNVASVEELEPTRQPEAREPSTVLEPVDEVSQDDDESQEDVRDELNGQMHLFD